MATIVLDDGAIDKSHDNPRLSGSSLLSGLSTYEESRIGRTFLSHSEDRKIELL